MCGQFVLASGMPLAAQVPGFLRTDGQLIRDKDGNVLILKGMGLGGWLLQEGYMLNMQVFANAEWEIRSRIEDLIGAANTDEFYRRYRQNFVQRKDIDSLKAWGFNSVRLPLNYKLLTPLDQPGVYLEAGFATIDSVLRWCEANQMYLILDLHSAPGGQSAGPIADYAGPPSLWESAEYRSRTVELWRTMAARYANETWIGGYDILNETAWDLGAGNVPLRDLLVAITQAIRTVDTNHVVFIEGNWYATNFAGLTPPWDNNMAYSFHKYWGETTTSTISGYLDIRNTYNVPLWLGETGENSNEWFTRNVELMADHSIGWAWWTLKKFGSISSPYSVRMTEGYEQLLSYWRGQTARPTAAAATAILFDMADRIDSDSCQIRYDVIDALMYHPFRTVRVPYVHHTLPGRIFATDYDNGRQGDAYYDTGFQNVGNGSYNDGWVYRNDGVDIWGCSDTITNGFYVGRIASGERLNYTVVVPQTDTFFVTIRISGFATGGKIKFRWDGADISPFMDVPLTGGDENWVTMELGRTVFTQGTHEFGMTFAFGGFNVNYVDIVSATSTGGGGEPVPTAYRLFQNYPNPFNPGTTIRFALPERSHVRIEIMNILGQMVDIIEPGGKDAGSHEVDWKTDASTGIFLYRLVATAPDGRQIRSETRKMSLLQ